jgi:hypothetical protein
MFLKSITLFNSTIKILSGNTYLRSCVIDLLIETSSCHLILKKNDTRLYY